MDSFAQKMLEKACQRSKNLGIKTDFTTLSEYQKNGNLSSSVSCPISQTKENLQESKILCNSDVNKSPVKNLKKTFSVDKENLGIEINVTSDHRIEMVQIEVTEEDGSSKKEIFSPNSDKQRPKIRDCSRNRLKRLGALYSNTDEISSPIHRTENQFCEETDKCVEDEIKSKKVTHKLNKLTELAKEIQNWEDDDEIKRKKNNFNDQKLGITKEADEGDSETTKKLKWDNVVMQNLEAQGFQRRQSNSTVLSYDYHEKINKATKDKENIKDNVTNVQKTTSRINNDTKIDEKSNFSVINISSTNVKSYKDPIEMPLKERMKIFEQKKGAAPVPKVPFAMNVPTRKICEEAVKEHIMLKVAQNKLGVKSSETNCIPNTSGKINFEIDKNIKHDQKISQTETEFKKQKSENPIPKKIVQGNLSAIVSQFEKKVDNINKEEQRTNSPKRLYPNLREFEDNSEKENSDFNEYSTETIYDEGPLRKSLRKSSNSSADDISYSLNISCDSINLEKPQVRFDIPERKTNYVCETNISNEHNINSSDSSINSKATENSEDISDYLNHAFDSADDENYDNESVTTNTDSIIKADHLESIQAQKKNINQIKSQLSVEESKENMVTLVHTISFYRKQQNNSSNPSTPIRKICREQEVRREISEISESENEDRTSIDQRDIETCLVKDKMAKLRDEVYKQQQIIAQTSQALNLCAATIEFSGSVEAVEGERHLLVATHRRQAALDEIQRLRVEGLVRPSGSPKEKGRLTVKEITVPLRQDYNIRKLSNDTISGHHLLCLLKYNEIVLATQTVSTLPGLLSVKFPDVLQLNEVFADFRVTLEIYGMTAQREILPHEMKYHININKNKNIRTPKKKGAADSRLIMPIVQSPAGPNVVRTPALVQYGFAIFSLREVQRNTWTLTKVFGVSPLEGTVHMKINCELSVSISYKGFLTMFEDISGFGAWHRRWCYLNGHILNYWKYPDDEKKSTPIGSIDLNTTITQKVTTAPRDICARLNTIMLECKTSCKDSTVTTKSSLMTVAKDNMIILRYLLSADTKEERDEWCAYLNKALMLLRAWSSAEK